MRWDSLDESRRTDLDAEENYGFDVRSIIKEKFHLRSEHGKEGLVKWTKVQAAQGCQIYFRVYGTQG